ncbi:MAG: PhoH family protein [Bacteroidales bacterium]|jgi:phosphate starvation-inducible PhoH-like protein|nr:PhoH family protein [Bacteroidales bacterium]
MTEKIISIETYNPLEIFGVNDANLNLLKSHFPKLKIVARGTEVKVLGNKSEIHDFERTFQLMLMHYERFGKLSESDMRDLLSGEGDEIQVAAFDNSDVLVYGMHGKVIKARSPNQQRMVDSARHNDLLFAIGPAGTGKTYTAVALAVQALKNKEVRRIILTRPAVEAGENLGFLPGDLKDKLDPYLQPLYDALRDMLSPPKLLGYLEDGTIEIAPLAFMRGRTLDNAFAILDEAQNATENQLKMFLTRMGRSAKFIVTGDITQIDLPRNQSSGLVQVTRILRNIPGIEFIFLNEKDIIRHKLVTRIIKAYSNLTTNSNNSNTPTDEQHSDKDQLPV